MAQTNANAQGADFFGEGVITAQPLLPKPRATSADGLTYVDTGEPTPLYYNRQKDIDGLIGPNDYVDNTFRPKYVQGQDRVLAPGQDRYKLDPKTGTYYTETTNGRRTYITNDPAANQRANETPIFTVPNGVGSSDNRNMFPLAAGNGSIAGRQGTTTEAARSNAYYAATGNSNPAASGGAAMGPNDLGAAAGAAQQRFNALGNERGTQAQDMFTQGAAAQGRAAASTGYVNYGGPQTVAKTQQAGVGNFGTEQRINAPTLASAQQAAMGNFGGEQRVSAAQVGGAQQATAQQANAQNARSIADLNFAQSDESRAAMGQNLNRISSYVDQGPGESMAQAQLRMAQEQNLGAALSLARSGRGNAAGNMKQAISENAYTNAQTNQQAALLRATEADQWRGRQLQGLGLEQQGATSMRSQDLGAAQAQGQHAISREQIASNVDVSNAQLGTQVSLGNAEQTNMGTRLQAQLSTDANLQQASLANARNVAMGQTGSQVNMANAEQSNLTSRMQGQLQSDAAIQQASLANQRNVALGQSGTQASISNADNSAAGERTRAQLANELAVASGNSQTNINQSNLSAQVSQNQMNDAQQQSLYGYGVDYGNQQLSAANFGAANAYDYANLGAEVDWRNLDRAAGIKTAEKDRKQKQESAYIGGLAAVLAGLA